MSANEMFYNSSTGEGYAVHQAELERQANAKIEYENSDAFKTEMQAELNKLEQSLVENSYKRLQPGVDTLKKDKVYYIIRSINLGRRVSVYPTKVTCIKVNTDGTGNFQDAEYGASIYNNISLDNYDGNKQKILGIWYRKPSLSTALGIGSASKYTAGKKIRKSKRKSRKSKKSRKTRQAKRR